MSELINLDSLPAMSAADAKTKWASICFAKVNKEAVAAMFAKKKSSNDLLLKSTLLAK